jgi:16S rRNA (guanine527-N7)-methyltransferase
MNKEQLLDLYAHAIYRENSKFNITGLSTLEEIEQVLIEDSLKPLKDINVPRGTLMADIGSGGGIPGVVLAIYHDALDVHCMDSNGKRMDFVNSFVQNNGILNVHTSTVRVEEAGKSSEHREQYDIVVSRAMAQPYAVMELGGPLVKENGFLYIYRHEQYGDIPSAVVGHGELMGLEVAEESLRSGLSISQKGWLFVKRGSTPVKYPRRFSVIKREALRLDPSQNR